MDEQIAVQASTSTTKSGLSSINKVNDDGSTKQTQIVVGWNDVLCGDGSTKYTLKQKLDYIQQYVNQGVYIDADDSQARYI